TVPSPHTHAQTLPLSHRYPDDPPLHSFPTRRSSDLHNLPLGARIRKDSLSNLEKEKQTVLLFMENGRDLYQNERKMALFISRYRCRWLNLRNLVTEKARHTGCVG